MEMERHREVKVRRIAVVKEEDEAKLVLQSSVNSTLPGPALS